MNIISKIKYSFTKIGALATLFQSGSADIAFPASLQANNTAKSNNVISAGTVLAGEYTLYSPSTPLIEQGDIVEYLNQKYCVISTKTYFFAGMEIYRKSTVILESENTADE